MKNFWLTVIAVILGVEGYAQNIIAGIDQGNNIATPAQVSNVIAPLTAADYFVVEAQKVERNADFDGAINLYTKAAYEYKQNKLYKQYAETLIKLSNAHLTIGNFTEAEHIALKQMLNNAGKTGNSRFGQMQAYQQLANIYLSANRLTESLWFYTQHGILAQQLQDKSAYIESVLGIASVKIKKKDYALASKDLSNAELLSKNSNIVQYNSLIKSNRAKIPEKFLVKKS